MLRVMQSWWFLLWTSVCCGLVVAFATWAAGGSSGAVRVVAALVGLAAGLGVMLLVAWALTPEEPSPVPEAPTAVSPPPEPVSEPPEPATTDRGPLTEQLEEGRALRAELDTGASDARVDAWIAGVRGALERQRPGVAGYFGALAGRAYTDDADKLDAHIGRLATIVHEFL